MYAFAIQFLPSFQLGGQHRSGNRTGITLAGNVIVRERVIHEGDRIVCTAGDFHLCKMQQPVRLCFSVCGKRFACIGRGVGSRIRLFVDPDTVTGNDVVHTDLRDGRCIRSIIGFDVTGRCGILQIPAVYRQRTCRDGAGIAGICNIIVLIGIDVQRDRIGGRDVPCAGVLAVICSGNRGRVQGDCIAIDDPGYDTNILNRRRIGAIIDLVVIVTFNRHRALVNDQRGACHAVSAEPVPRIDGRLCQIQCNLVGSRIDTAIAAAGRGRKGTAGISRCSSRAGVRGQHILRRIGHLAAAHHDMGHQFGAIIDLAFIADRHGNFRA